MSITRVNFNPIPSGGDNVTGALVKLDANDADLDARLSAAQGSISGLGSAATKNVGTTAGTVAAGDDARFLNRGYRNLIVNGGLLANQRGFAGGSQPANTYGFDRWRTFGAGASFTRSVDRSTFTLNGTIGQVIETALAGATITVSVKNPSGAIAVNIRPDATTAGVSGSISSGVGVQSVTLAVPSSITGAVFVQLTTASAVTFDGSAKQSGIQVELGSFASAFELRPMALEFALCQRYYCKSFDPDVAPALNIANSVNGQTTHIATGLGTGNARTEGIPFPVQMRAVPAITLYTTSSAPSQANSWALFTSSYFTCPSPSASASTNGFNVTLVFGSGLVQAASYTVAGHWTADSEF